MIIAPEFFSGQTTNSSSHDQNHSLGFSDSSFRSIGDDGGSDANNFDYPALFVTGAAELLGCILAFAIIERIGRKILAGTGYLFSGACMALIVLSMPRGAGVFMVMVIRASILIGTSVTWVMTPELYKTEVRAAGHSWCNAAARVGAFAAPYWGDARSIAFSTRLFLFAAVNCVAAMSTFFLPRETRGIALD